MGQFSIFPSLQHLGVWLAEGKRKVIWLMYKHAGKTNCKELDLEWLYEWNGEAASYTLQSRQSEPVTAPAFR